MLGMKVMRQKITTRVRTTVGRRSLTVLRTLIFLKRTARAPAMARSSQKKVQSGAVMWRSVSRLVRAFWAIFLKN